MARLIYADELRNEMHGYVFPITTNNLMGAADVYYRILHLLDDMPTVDAVEVVHGEWIKADSMPRSAKCSECNCWITRHTINENWFRYCPHCGAKMDGGDKA